MSYYKSKDRSHARPPTAATKLLDLFLPDQLKNFLVGDLFEEYSRRTNQLEDHSNANRWFWKQTISQLFYWWFRDNLVTLTCAMNIVFYTTLYYLFETMSHLALSLDGPELSLKLAIPFSISIVIILRNSGMLANMYDCVFSRTVTLSVASLTRISQFARLMKISGIGVCIAFALTAGLEFIEFSSLNLQSIAQHSSLGLTWMLFVHSLAWFALFLLLEDKTVRDSVLGYE